MTERLEYIENSKPANSAGRETALPRAVKIGLMNKRAPKTTSTNPMATLFAWTGALRKRAQMDGLKDLEDFAARLEKSAVSTIESGIITGDLDSLLDVPEKKVVNTTEFLKAVAAKL